ncbi:MAG: DNA adenine methylase [bacterium]
MKQLHLFNEATVHRAPNVASVPQYSPLRYPGGKTWLYPFVKRWLFHKKDKILIEPFAGGASVGLAAAIENCVKHVILVEKDYNGPQNLDNRYKCINQVLEGPWVKKFTAPILNLRLLLKR